MRIDTYARTIFFRVGTRNTNLQKAVLQQFNNLSCEKIHKEFHKQKEMINNTDVTDDGR